MLKKLTQIFGRNTDAPKPARQIPVEEHGIPPHRIAGSAKKVIETLQNEGWEAYLVGGGVRDSLLGASPKDFDVATNATPEQVNRIFRRSRIIGRRFKIVHVRIGRELIEVTTFRGEHASQKSGRHASQNEKGVLVRDNVFGDLESDARRRDFTVNALYYNPSTEEVVDFCKGYEDLCTKTLRIIGDPLARYKEDPVRLLRAVRFKVKLGFHFDEATQAPILEHADYLKEIPAARLFEEVLKLFLSGKAEQVLHELHHYGLLTYLIPGAARVLNQGSELEKRLLFQAAENTDKRIAENKRVTPAFIYAAFLWPALQEEMQLRKQGSRAGAQDLLFKAADAVVYEQQKYTAIPKRFQIPMKEIWSLQLRFERRDAKRAFALLEHPRFRAAYDFILLREQAGENLNGLGQWWTDFQFADREKQLSMLENKRGGRRRSPRKPSNPASNNE